jgi:glycerate 2-kinase
LTGARPAHSCNPHRPMLYFGRFASSRRAGTVQVLGEEALPPLSRSREVPSMQEGSRAEKLLALFRDVVLPLADAYLATRRVLLWAPQEQALVAGARSYSLADIEDIFLVGAGKAGVPMARAVTDVLKQDDCLWAKFAGGTLNVYRDQADASIPKVMLFAADHPNPNDASIQGAKAALELLSAASSNDLVIALISGGGSSLLSLPQEGISLEDLRATSRVLVTGGPTIQEINTVRKHLSQVKGGRLRMAAPEAEFLTLVLSDVIGDDLSSIASGPTVPDPTTCQDAVHILRSHGLWERIPEASRLRLLSRDPEEDAKADLWRERLTPRTQNIIVASNAVLLDSLSKELSLAQYRDLTACVHLEQKPVTGTVEEAVEQHYRRAIGLAAGSPRPTLMLFGGEPVVSVPEHAHGTGGRMLHYALLVAMRIAGTPWAVLASGTDGIDGTSPAAGAVVTGETMRLAEQNDLNPGEYLASYDSYGFFSEMEARTGKEFLNLTGPTGTNVNDIMLWLCDT